MDLPIISVEETQSIKRYISSFSKKYNLNKLVYVERHTDVNEARAREKQLKNWHRDWKINLVKQINPLLEDLSEQIG